MKAISGTYTRDFNFIPERILERHKRKRLFIILFIVSLTLLASMAAGYMLPGLIAESNRANIRMLNDQLAGLQKAEPQYQKLKSLEGEYRTKQQALQNIHAENKSYIAVMNTVTAALPAGVYITSIKYNAEESLYIGLIADTPVAIARLLVKLQETELFEEITLQGKDIPLAPTNDTVILELVFKGSNREKLENKKTAEEEPEDKNVAYELESEINKLGIETQRP